MCPKQFYLLGDQEGTVLLWVPLNRLKASGVGVHIPVRLAGDAAAFQEKRLLLGEQFTEQVLSQRETVHSGK